MSIVFFGREGEMLKAPWAPRRALGWSAGGIVVEVDHGPLALWCASSHLGVLLVSPRSCFEFLASLIVSLGEGLVGSVS